MRRARPGGILVEAAAPDGRREEKLSARTERYDSKSDAQHLVSLLNEAAFVYERQTRRIVAWNPLAEEILGVAEAHARTLAEVLGLEAPLPPEETRAGAVKTVLRLADGSRRAAKTSFSPIADGELVLAIVRLEEAPEPSRATADAADRARRFQIAFERAATGIALADLSGRFIEGNPVFQNLVGFKLRELRHLTFNALTHPEDRAMEAMHFQDLIEGRRDFYDATKRLINKDGVVVWIQASVSLAKDPDGTPLYCIILVNDVTEERRADQRAAIQLTLTRVLADSPPPNVAIVQVLQAICKTLDWQIGEFWMPDDTEGGLRREVGWQVPDFNAADFVRFGQHHAMAPGEGLPGKVWLEGSPAWFSDVMREENFLRRRMAEQAGIKGALAFPVRSGERMLGVMVFAYRDFRHPDESLLAMMTDFGEQLGAFLVRKQAENHLKMLGAIVNASGRAIVGTDLRGIITSWTLAAKRLFGYSKDEAIGRPWAMLFTEGQVEQLADMLERVHRGEPATSLRMRAIAKSGRAKEVSVTPSLLCDEGGASSGIWMTIYDASTS